MKIALAQIDPIVGDFEGNFQKIVTQWETASLGGARVVLTPELGICGYPPHDLIDRPELLEQCQAVLSKLCQLSKRWPKTALVVGYVSQNESPLGRATQNSVSVIENGEIVLTQAKTLLPTYDVFDEARYFEPAQTLQTWDCDGTKVALAICEDLWASDHSVASGRKLYGRDPVEGYLSQGVKLILSASSSPFETDKRELRENLHAEVAKRAGAHLVYVNQTGANDEILFDGQSFGINPEGKLITRLKAFEPDFGIVDLENLRRESTATFAISNSTEQSVLLKGLITGIREYFARTGFKSALLGLSGGIDSAVVASLAVQALGAKRVTGIAMPSQFSSGHSLEDAEILAKNLGIRFEVRPIKFMYSNALRECSEGRGTLAPIAQENLQSRLRGIILMTLSNHDGSLVLATGNKSELAMGYCTLYGDMNGALLPLGDVFKTKVYEVGRALQDLELTRNAIPERSFTKAPSAELRPGQTDQDSLPPYEDLDKALALYLEDLMPISEIKSRLGFPWIEEVFRKVEMAEYKRRQAAPVLKISSKAFGLGRRMPIAKKN